MTELDDALIARHIGGAPVVKDGRLVDIVPRCDVVPYATSYVLGTKRLADERVMSACVNSPGLTAASFTNPRQLPACPYP